MDRWDAMGAEIGVVRAGLGDVQGEVTKMKDGQSITIWEQIARNGRLDWGFLVGFKRSRGRVTESLSFQTCWFRFLFLLFPCLSAISWRCPKYIQ